MKYFPQITRTKLSNLEVFNKHERNEYIPNIANTTNYYKGKHSKSTKKPLLQNTPCVRHEHNLIYTAFKC